MYRSTTTTTTTILHYASIKSGKGQKGCYITTATAGYNLARPVSQYDKKHLLLKQKKKEEEGART